MTHMQSRSRLSSHGWFNDRFTVILPEFCHSLPHWLELRALLQRVVVTVHRRQATEECWRAVGLSLSPEEILQSPYVLIGTVDQLI
jgi:hypothetical protein